MFSFTQYFLNRDGHNCPGGNTFVARWIMRNAAPDAFFWSAGVTLEMRRTITAKRGADLETFFLWTKEIAPKT